MNTKQLLALLFVLGSTFVGRASAQTYGAQYVSAITYANPGDQMASITFSFYPEGSGTAINETRTLAGHATGSLNVGSLTSISAGFRGSVVIRSDRQIIATVVQLPPSSIVSKTRPLSNAMVSTSSRVVLGTVVKNAFNLTTVFSAQNADSVANDLTVTFRATDGTQVHVATVSALPPGASKRFDLGTLAELGSSFTGWVEIVAARAGGTPGRVVATALELGTAASGASSKYATAFEAVVPSAAPHYTSRMMCKFSAMQNNTNTVLTNAGASVANVTVRYTPSGVAYPVPLGAQATTSVNACTAGNANGYFGDGTVESDQPVVVVQKTSGGGTSSAWTVNEVGDTLVASYVRWAADAAYNVSGGTQRSFLRIVNAGTQDIAGPISVLYYDPNGTLVETHQFAGPLAAGAGFDSNPNVNHPTNTTFSFGYYPSGGSAVIVGPTGSKLSAVVHVQSYLTYSTELAAESYEAMYLRPAVVADNCAPNPCLNGGTCNAVGNGYTCTCTSGFSGSNCEMTPNPCGGSPCMNGGTCMTSGAGYTCQCAAGYTGAMCETNIDNCSPNPCLNGGTCMDGVNAYTCQCVTGYTGTMCETNVDNCSPNPCENGGVCTDGVNSFSCACAPGFGGLTCATATVTADFTTIAGMDVSTYGGLLVARGLEFYVASPVTVSSLVVSGLPPGQEATALLWHKTGAVDLQVTDTFSLGSSIAPSSTGTGTATFTFATPFVLDAGTHSLVLAVDDPNTGEWSMRQLDNSGQSLTVGAVTFESVWGWRGDVDTSTGVASNVSIYDSTYFYIPRISLVLAP